MIRRILLVLLVTLIVGLLLHMAFPLASNVKSRWLELLSTMFVVVSLVIRVANSPQSLSSTLKMVLAWVLIGAFVVIGYSYRFELGEQFGKIKSRVIPTSARIRADGVVEIAKSADGHFVVDAFVNGKTVRFLIDTGASFIALTHEDARRIGINFKNLSYIVPVRTASGMHMCAYVELSSVRLGSINEKNLSAYVMPPTDSDGAQSLLGMNFLARLGEYRVSGDAMYLRARS